MLDSRARRVVAPTLQALARPLAAAGVAPLALTAVGWVCGVGACVAVALHADLLALGLWLANRLLDGLDGPVARIGGSSELGGFLDIVADFSVYAGFIVGLGIGQPAARVACLALLCAYYVSGTAFLALSALLERLGGSIDDGYDDGRSLRFVGGIAEGTETVLVYIAFCLLPGYTEPIAWIFTAAVAITAAQRVVLGVHLLHRRDRRPTPQES